MKYQIAYAALSGVVSGGLFLLLARLDALRARPFRRLLAAELILGAACVAAFLLLAKFVSLAVPFGAVSVALYGGAFWLPLASVLAGLLRWRRREAGFPVPLVLLAALTAGVALYGMFVEPNRLTVREERITVKGWPDGLPPFRIVHLSDLQTTGTRDREARAARIVADLQPDLIVLTGDYVSGPVTDHGPAFDSARAFFETLHAPLGVVAVAGHSESGAVRRRLVEGLDIRLLSNDGVRIPVSGGRSVYVYGLDVHHPVLPRGGLPRIAGELAIVASHVPDVTRDLTDRGVDLHLAGHTHGGQVVIPGFGAPLTLSGLPRRYARGLHRFGDHWLNVSAGIGMEGNHAPPLRLFCPPEICLILVGGESALTAAAPR